MSPLPEPSCHPALLLDLVVNEILIRSPPDEPERLARASLVCKDWHRVMDDPGFRRRYAEFHASAAPVLGLIHNVVGGHICDSRFAPITSFSTRHPLRYRCVLDSRHGRVLFWTYKDHRYEEFDGVDDKDRSLIVWDPITDVERWPAGFRSPSALTRTGSLTATGTRWCSAPAMAATTSSTATETPSSSPW
ncbi:hypothetical protein VPH35_084851 [Triticum aestivum]